MNKIYQKRRRVVDGDRGWRVDDDRAVDGEWMAVDVAAVDGDRRAGDETTTTRAYATSVF
jgi:hypothetical protein